MFIKIQIIKIYKRFQTQFQATIFKFLPHASEFMNIQINKSIQLLLNLISSHNFKFLKISSVFENKSIVLGPLLFGNGSTWGALPYIVKCELGPK
jgi:hypothetical protein